MVKLKFTAFCSKLYKFITIKVMNIVAENVVSGNLYTVSSSVLQIFYVL